VDKMGAAPLKDNKQVLENVKSAHAERSLITLADYYESVAACVAEAGCDNDVACAMLKDNVQYTLDTYWEWFKSWKATAGSDPIAKTKVFLAGCGGKVPADATAPKSN
jgi:hypothetical protein